MHLSPAQVQKRLVHRADDNLEAIQARIAQYKANVNAVRGYFRLPLYLRARERKSARTRARESLIVGMILQDGVQGVAR